MADMTWQGFSKKISCLVENLYETSIPNTKENVTKSAVPNDSLKFLLIRLDVSRGNFPNHKR